MTQAVFVTVQGEGHLLETVATTKPASRFSGLLNGWQQHSNKHANDGDDNQQFDQRETAASPTKTRLKASCPGAGEETRASGTERARSHVAPCRGSVRQQIGVVSILRFSLNMPYLRLRLGAVK